VCAHRASSLQALEIVEQLLHTLLASPSVIMAGAIEGAVKDGCGLVQRLLAAGSAQAVDTRHPHGFNPMHLAANRETGRDMERIAQVLHDANKDWIRAQSSDGGLPLHCACGKGQHALIAFFAGLVSGGARERCRRLAAYSLPTHSEGA
jgi:hypothetical protein